jgi:hypothetical protein
MIIYESTQYNFPYECFFSNIIVRTSNFAHEGGIHTAAVFSALISEQWEVKCWKCLAVAECSILHCIKSVTEIMS